MLDVSLRPGGGRVILLEDDAGLREVLLELFSDEGFEVDACVTLDEIYTAFKQHPGAVVVADSWTAGDYAQLGQCQRMEIEALGRTAPLILTTGRAWGRQLDPASVATRHDCCQTIRPRRPARTSGTGASAICR